MVLWEQLASTEEHVDGAFTGNLGEVLIRYCLIFHSKNVFNLVNYADHLRTYPSCFRFETQSFMALSAFFYQPRVYLDSRALHLLVRFFWLISLFGLFAIQVLSFFLGGFCT